MNAVSIILSLFIFFLPSSAYASAPDLSLKDMQGVEQPLSQYIGKGKWTVLVIWAEDCEACNAEIQSYDFFHEENKNKNAQVLGLSIDGWAKIKLARDFVNRHSLSFPNLVIDLNTNEILKLGGGDIIGTPTIYIYTPAGEIVAAQAGAVPVSIIEDFIKNWKK